MQSAVHSKKNSFKCPTFAVPSKKSDAQKDSSADIKTEEQSVNKDVKKPVPSAAGDNIVDEKKAGSATCLNEENVKEVQDRDLTVKVEKAVKKKMQKPKSESKEKDDSMKKKNKKRKIEKENIQQNEDKSKLKEKNSAEPVTTENLNEESTNKIDFANSVEKPLDTGELDTAKSNQSKGTKDRPEKNQINPKIQKKKTLNSKQTLPVRSLTDEEYDEIFTAALENAMKLDLDKWNPKVTSPVRVREPVKKKYGITVGKKPSPKPEDTAQDEKAGLEDNTETSVQDGDHCEKNANADIPKPAKAENKQEPVIINNDKDVEVNGDIELVENDVHSDIDQHNEADIVEPFAERMNDDQKENETTPAASETDFNTAPDQACPPPKKKKIQVKKKAHLEPKQLPFSDEQLSDKDGSSQRDEYIKTATPMIDKIKKLKKLKKEMRKKRKEKGIFKKKKSDSECNETSKKRKKDMGNMADSKSDKARQRTKSKKIDMLDRDLDNDGTWVQCCTCNKWRHLKDVLDPSQLPEIWTCNMNTCEEYNSCDKEEEKYDESEHIYTKFVEGSVVWAKMAGYPWWPAMVEQDPDAETYFSVDNENSMQPTHFHVVFFDERVSRTWVKAGNIKAYSGHESNDGVIIVKMTKRGSHNYSKEINVAKRNANRALNCSIKTRIELFGFAARYSGTWSKVVQEEQSATTGSSKEKQKKRKHKMTTYKPPADLLDDSAVVDIIENTETILENVENLLDNLDDHLGDDSELDSDFQPEGLIVVEKKRRQSRKGQDKKKHRKKLEFSSESEPENDNNYGTDNNSVLETDNNETESKKMKFDSDIFTTELEDEVAPVSDFEVKNDMETVIMISENEKDFSVPSEKNDASTALTEEVGKQNEVKTHGIEDVKYSENKLENVLEVDIKVDFCDNTTKETCVCNVSEGSLDSPECHLSLNNNHELSVKENSDDDFNISDEENDIVPGSPNKRTNAFSQQSLNVGEDSDNDFDLQDTSLYDSIVDGAEKSQERAVSPVQVVTFSQGSSDPFDMIEE